MDRVWDTSWYPPKPFVTLCQVKLIQGHEIKKVKFKIGGLVGMMHAFRSDFRAERKHDHWTLFEQPKPDKIRISGNCRNPRK